MAECSACHAKQWLSSDLPPLEQVSCTKCGHPVIVPAKLRNFEVREIVASGGMGTVYRAFDVSLERMVAIKMLKREMADDKQVMESFYREARATASLNHTNIIHVYSFDEHEGSPYIVMELADHGSLDNWIIRDGFVPELNVLDVGIKVASALESALQRNLLHRDIKPGNILFNEYGEPKLVDFGLARQAAENEEYEAAVWGTPYYVAPEKIQRQGEDFHSDMYSLGGTLYHALTGHVPFEAETVEQVVAGHVHTPLTPPCRVRTDITQLTNDAIVTAMAKDPAQRFATYGQLQMALENARSQLLVENLKHQQHAERKEHGRSWWRR
jgi:serine/threonine protein kinase